MESVLRYYRHENPEIEEFLDPKYFEKESVSQYPEDYTNDIVLALGTHYVIQERKLFDNDIFFIVEGGAPHIPAISIYLRYNNIEPYLYLTGLVNRDPREYWQNYAYFGPRFHKLKKGERIARVFDTHSNVERNKHLPESEYLKEKGIERIEVLLEGDILGLNREYDTKSEWKHLLKNERRSLRKAIENYEKDGFEVHIYETDARATKSSFETILRNLERDDKLVEFTIGIWGRKGKLETKEDLFRILRNFEKNYF